MEVYKQLLVWLSVLFVVGAFLNIVVAPFVDSTDYTSTIYQDNVSGSLTSATSILSGSSSAFINEQVDLFNLIPSFITIPFFIIGAILLILTLLNLIPFVG